MKLWKNLKFNSSLYRRPLPFQIKIEEIVALQRDLEIAEIDFDRYKELFNKGVISTRDLENKEIGYLKIQREYGDPGTTTEPVAPRTNKYSKP